MVVIVKPCRVVHSSNCLANFVDNVIDEMLCVLLRAVSYGSEHTLCGPLLLGISLFINNNYI